METHLRRWSLDRMNMAAVFAPKKLYGYPSCGSFAGVLKLKFAATSRTRLVTDVFGFHRHPQGWAEVGSLRQANSNEKHDLHRPCQRDTNVWQLLTSQRLCLAPIALGRRVPCRCSVFICANVAAVFAPKDVYGCPGSVVFNRLLEFQFAATSWTRLTDADIHCDRPLHAIT